MIRYEDLLIARALSRGRPELRGVLLGLIQRLDRVRTFDSQSLLALLLEGSVVPRVEAEAVHRRVRRHVEEQALAIFRAIVADRGVQLGAVRTLEEAEREAARSLPDAASLRTRAKLVQDRHHAVQVEAFRRRRAWDGASEVSGEEIAQTQGVACVEPPPFAVPGWIDTSDAEAGSQVGAYRLIGRIGSGSMGVVYLAAGEGRSGPVAVKVLPRGVGEEGKARFKREILANGFVAHASLVDVYDAGEDGSGRAFLAMEFVDGEDLEELLATVPRLPWAQAVWLVEQVARGLEAAHGAGVVHRDVKPANVLVREDNTAKLMDFGLARIVDLGDFRERVFQSQEGGACGTPHYFAPEQACGLDVTGATDVYALGGVLYRLVEGRLAFSANSLQGWIQQHLQAEPAALTEGPEELRACVGQALAKSPDERPSAGAFADTLRALRETHAPGPIPPFPHFRRGF